ncbi:serine hydrolase [Dokdonella sp. MW10]|uniref:serine hydrolase n=1 Tax=Dokdonella sp. MW10 TaxID=2992926 RepID=UPI003F821B2E
MIRPLLLAALAALATAQAEARPLFSDAFDPPVIAPLFPAPGGTFQLPAGGPSDALAWLLGELAAGQTTTIAEIEARFDPAFLATMPASQVQATIQSLRTTYPNAVVTDVVGVTPMRATVVIDSPDSPPPSGYLSLGTRFTGDRRITLFSASTYGGSVQYVQDRTLTLEQAADKFATLSASPGLFVGRIAPNGQCSAIIARQGTTPRATASIFKLWVLAGVARAIAAGPVSAADGVPLVASEFASGGIINNEPLGTVFTVQQLATLMMGNSDNTSTDLLHQLVGRVLIGQAVTDSGVAQPDLLLPLLGISEQFHLFSSFPLAEALTYVNGTQAFKAQFLSERIEPLGPFAGGPYANTSLYVDGSWRASAQDVCRAFSMLRRLPQGSEAIRMTDAALGSQVAQPDVRRKWDRVWYKGGSLASGANGLHVLTHAWMLEDAGRDPYVVVAMSNAPTGGIDTFAVQSITGRLLELVSLMP